MDRQFEKEIQSKVEAWKRQNGDPTNILAEISTGITSKTFNSATLMRLQAEVLLLSNQPEEAKAAFDTYVSLQKLSLFKARSGANSLPDTLEGTVELFLLVLTAYEYEGPDSLEKAAEISTKLASIVEEMATTYQQVLIAPVMARSFLARMIVAEGEQAYLEAEREARRWFHQMDQQSSDSESCYAFGLFLALVGTPQSALAPVKLSLVKDPQHMRSALLLTQLLTTDTNRLGESLKVANAYLRCDQPAHVHTTVGKLTLLQLKKTQVALLEEIEGRDAALSELEPFIELATALYSTKTKSSASSASLASKPAAKKRLFFGSSTTVEPHVASEATQTIYQQELAFCWMWIAMQYAKFSLDDEALEAVEEARELWPKKLSMRENAHIEALLGHIYRQRDPKRALEHYRQALVTYSFHISAAVSAALIVVDEKFGDSEFELQLLGFLDAVSVRSPGRFIPEVWHARALLHQSLGGDVAARTLFWRALELEERRALTSYLLLSAAV